MNTINSSLSSSPSTPDSNYCIDHPALRLPDHPLQYRAIGIVQGIYQPLANTMTKGIMITTDGKEIETVLLARTISAVKNHINLNELQNWVIYPHSITETNDLHFQIAGIHLLDKNSSLPKNYFSIRGEIIYSSKYKQKIIVKVLDNNFTSRRKARSFKLELKGRIPDNRIKHFFSLGAFLEGNSIVVQDYVDLGFVAVNY